MVLPVVWWLPVYQEKKKRRSILFIKIRENLVENNNIQKIYIKI